jgi:hypothetical protein
MALDQNDELDSKGKHEKHLKIHDFAVTTRPNHVSVA